MPRRLFNRYERKELENREKLSREKAKYVFFIEKFKDICEKRFEEDIKGIETFVNSLKDETQIESIIFLDRKNVISSINDIETIIKSVAKFKPSLKDYINANITPKTIESASTLKDINQINQLHLNYLKELLKGNPNLKTQLGPEIQEKIFQLEGMTLLSSNPLLALRQYIIYISSQEEQLIKEFTSEFADEIIDYVSKKTTSKIDQLPATPEESFILYLEMVQHVREFFAVKHIEVKQKFSDLIFEYENKFVFSDNQKKDFEQNLETGNLKKLLDICSQFPAEFNNELYLQESFDRDMREYFKSSFLQALDKNCLKEFVENNLGSKIIGQFPKYKKSNGGVDFESFAKDIEKLKNKDTIFDIIVNIFHELISIFGVKNVMRNTSKERFYLNIVRAAENISPILTNFADNNGEKPEEKGLY